MSNVVERLGYVSDPRGDLDVLLVPGKGWTAIVCSDPELLCERPEGEEKPALALVAKAVERSAFQISVHDGDSITLLETTPKGRVVASGGEGSTASAFFHAERIYDEHFFLPRFYALPVKSELRAIAGDDLFHDQLITELVPDVEPFALLRGDVIDFAPEGAVRLSFATTERRSSRPPRPFRWWKGIVREGGVLGTEADVKSILARRFGAAGIFEIAGVPVETELVIENGVVRQIDVKVIATDEGMPKPIGFALAAACAEEGWTLLDFN